MQGLGSCGFVVVRAAAGWLAMHSHCLAPDRKRFGLGGKNTDVNSHSRKINIKAEEIAGLNGCHSAATSRRRRMTNAPAEEMEKAIE